jgi:hypothetical protein
MASAARLAGSTLPTAQCAARERAHQRRGCRLTDCFLQRHESQALHNVPGAVRQQPLSKYALGSSRARRSAAGAPTS